MAYKVGSKGQVVIDKRIRDELGVEPGFVAVQRRVGDRVEIRFHPAEHDRSLFGVLRYAARPVGGDEEWAEVRERAWNEEVRAKHGRGEG